MRNPFRRNRKRGEWFPSPDLRATRVFAVLIGVSLMVAGVLLLLKL